MLTLKDLEKACANYRLTDLLKELSDEELSNLMYLILLDDVVGIRVNIYDALYNEVEYRKNEELAFHMYMNGSK